MLKTLEPDPSQAAIFDHHALRLFIGIIAVFLPVALPIVVGHSSFDEFLTSMSAYYHDDSRDIFVGCLTGIAILLFAYNGRGPLDLWVSKLAGVFALGVAFFPITQDEPTSYEQTLCVLHYICATGLFLILALFCLALFPNTRFKKKNERTVRERRRDAIYYVCGWLILICIVLIGISSLMSKEFQQTFKPAFFLEWIALTAFGISWFTAGKYWRIKFLVDEEKAYRFLKSS